jgi:hypothetical protein
MEFRRPFDPVQRAAAAQLYREYRKHVKVLRSTYPPLSEREKELFVAYKDLVQDFGRAAALDDAKGDTGA